MQLRQVVVRSLVTFLLTTLYAQCGSHAVAHDGEQPFHNLTESFLTDYFRFRPEQASALGLHEYDGKSPDFRASALRDEAARLRKRLAAFQALPADTLKPRDQIDLRLVVNAIKGELFGLEELRVYQTNPMTYVGRLDVSIYLKRDYAPIEKRLGHIVALEKHVPVLLGIARANLDQRLPKPFVETAIQMANGAADFLAHDLVTGVSSVKDASLRRAFHATNRRAVVAFRSYAAWLKRSRLPLATNKYALGQAKYVKMLENSEMISASPEQILELGLSELRKEQAIFATAAQVIDPKKPPASVFKAIQSNHPTASSLIADARRDLDAIRQFLIHKQIVTIPSQVRATVAETPPMERAGSFASMDTPGPFETKATTAYYYITPVDKSWTRRQAEEWLTSFNYYTLDLISIHEAYPGHFVQFLHLNSSKAPRLEKIFGSYAFAEGWAHYAEKMIVDEGYGSEDPVKAAKYRMAQSAESLLRFCRLCVSVKMHCQGMTIEEGTKFFHDNCYYEMKPAHEEALRGSFDPGYLFYSIGKLQILKLRDDYRKEQGDAFSLQRFHDTLLDNGMLPLRLLREIMLSDPSMGPRTLPGE